MNLNLATTYGVTYVIRRLNVSLTSFLLSGNEILRFTVHSQPFVACLLLFSGILLAFSGPLKTSGGNTLGILPVRSKQKSCVATLGNGVLFYQKRMGVTGAMCLSRFYPGQGPVQRIPRINTAYLQEGFAGKHIPVC